MKYNCLDFIACPVDKHFPLQLKASKVTEEDSATDSSYRCEQYCGYSGEMIAGKNTMPCQVCSRQTVEQGVLFCPECGSSYRIENGIPELIPEATKTGQTKAEVEAKKAEIDARARPSKEAIVSILTSKQHQLMRQIEFDVVSRCLDVQSNDIVLDNGAGYGIFSVPLSRHCRYVVATDITFEVLDAFKEYVFNLNTSYFRGYVRFPENKICLIQADSCYLPFRKGFYFSRMLSTEVLSHIPGQGKSQFVNESREFLAPGGRLVLTVGNDHIVRRLARGLRLVKAPKEAILDDQFVGYFHKFNSPELISLLKEGNFSIDEVFGCHILSYLPGGSNDKVARLANILQHTPCSSALGDILVANCVKKQT